MANTRYSDMDVHAYVAHVTGTCSAARAGIDGTQTPASAGRKSLAQLFAESPFRGALQQWLGQTLRPGSRAAVFPWTSLSASVGVCWLGAVS